MSVLTSEQPHLLSGSASLPALRLLPVPVSEPPYDDELHLLSAAQSPPIGPLRSLSRLRLVPDPPADDAEPSRARTPTEALPAARPVAHALVQALLEVLAGVRPITQLRRDTSTELYERLEQILRYRPRPTGVRPHGGAVRSLHIQQRPEGVAEICATVQRGGRAGALALRLEGVDGRWSCTALAGF